MDVPMECPACGEDFRERWIDANGQEQEGSRVIGVYSTELDRTTHWRCPDCGHEWERE